VANFFPYKDEETGHFWLAISLTYCLFLCFNFIAFKYQQNQKKLAETYEKLQNRLNELAELHKQTQDLHKQNLKLAVIDERNRIAREIHDVLAQGFTAIILQVEVAQVQKNLSEEVKERFSQIDRLARYNLKEARRSVSNLRPLALESGSILQALKQKADEYSAENNIKTTFSTSGQPVKLSIEVETALFRINQEALSNVVKHAKASEVTVSLDYDEEEVCLTVQDNGRGFLLAAQKSQEITGFGLSTMQERARLVGGLTTIQTQPDSGCRVRVIVPYERRNDDHLISEGL
jgi:signal transduction histidine kinase